MYNIPAKFPGFLTIYKKNKMISFPSPFILSLVLKAVMCGITDSGEPQSLRRSE